MDFPIEITKPIKKNFDYVYNFVLEDGHSALINDVTVVTLGHNFTSNSVIKHNFYGTQKVIDNLARFEGWEEGLVVLDKPKFERDINGNISNISM